MNLDVSAETFRVESGFAGGCLGSHENPPRAVQEV